MNKAQQSPRYTVYRLDNAAGEPLYVGMTIDVSRRLYEHRSQKPWFVREVANLIIEQFDTVDEAADHEIELTATLAPRYNAPTNGRYALHKPAGSGITGQTTMLTVQQTAERLGMTPQAVRRAIEQGRLAARRFGHMYQIDVREVEGYRTKPKGSGGRPRQERQP